MFISTIEPVSKPCQDIENWRGSRTTCQESSNMTAVPSIDMSQDTEQLQELKHQIFDLVKTKGKMKVSQISRVLNRPKRTIQTQCSELVKEKVLKVEEVKEFQGAIFESKYYFVAKLVFPEPKPLLNEEAIKKIQEGLRTRIEFSLKNTMSNSQNSSSSLTDSEQDTTFQPSLESPSICPKKQKILLIFEEIGEISVPQLAKRLGQPASTIDYHVKSLNRQDYLNSRVSSRFQGRAYFITQKAKDSFPWLFTKSQLPEDEVKDNFSVISNSLNNNEEKMSKEPISNSHNVQANNHLSSRNQSSSILGKLLELVNLVEELEKRKSDLIAELSSLGTEQEINEILARMGLKI